MRFLLALAIAVIFVAACQKPIKKYPAIFYIIAVALAAVGAFCSFPAAPDWVKSWVLTLCQRGTLSTAIFAVAMYTGALKNGSALIKRLMPIRGELSIIASILTLGHYIYFGKTYYVFLFTDPGVIPPFTLVSTILTLCQLVILLPLLVTSFKAVRKKMAPAKWKKLQRFAYGFYGLTYLHIMLVNIGGLLSGSSKSVINVIVYTLVFGAYLVLRLRKATGAKI